MFKPVRSFPLLGLVSALFLFVTLSAGQAHASMAKCELEFNEKNETTLRVDLWLASSSKKLHEIAAELRLLVETGTCEVRTRPAPCSIVIKGGEVTHFVYNRGGTELIIANYKNSRHSLKEMANALRDFQIAGFCEKPEGDS